MSTNSCLEVSTPTARPHQQLVLLPVLSEINKQEMFRSKQVLCCWQIMVFAVLMNLTKCKFETRWPFTRQCNSRRSPWLKQVSMLHFMLVRVFSQQRTLNLADTTNPSHYAKTSTSHRQSCRVSICILLFATRSMSNPIMH